MALLVDTCTEANNNKRALLHFGKPFWRDATAILIPTDGPVRCVTVGVAPKFEREQYQDKDRVESFVTASSSFLQGNTMSLLTQEDGCGDFGLLRRETARRFPGTYTAFEDLPEGGWAGIIDSCKTDFDSGTLEMFFLGGDNGFPLGVMLMKQLPLNRNLDNKVYGPVVVFVETWGEVDGMEFAAQLDISDALLVNETVMQDMFVEVKAGVARRYKDAGVHV